MRVIKIFGVFSFYNFVLRRKFGAFDFVLCFAFSCDCDSGKILLRRNLEIFGNIRALLKF